jgi:LacI family sucrose operon transcriptional repressor
MANQNSKAFIDVCCENKIEYIVVPTEENHFASMTYYTYIRKLLQEHPDVDGIFASNDIIAAQVIQVAHEFGLNIPNDLKVVGYDDIYIAQLTSPQITTVSQPIKQVCKYAIDAILNATQGETVPLRTILPVKLIERGSA